MQPLSRAVAAEVNDRLQELGWTGRELARRSGLQQPNVAHKVAGRRAFRLDELVPVCEAIGLRVPDLIERALRR